VGTGRFGEGAEHQRHERSHRAPGEDTDPAAAPSVQSFRVLRNLLLEETHRPDAVLHLLEVVIGVRRWQLESGAEVELVGAEGPGDAPLGTGYAGLCFQQLDRGATFLGLRFPNQVMLAELGEPDRDHRSVEHRGTQPVQVIQSPLEHLPVVDAGRHHDLGMELDAERPEMAELLHDVRRERVPEQVASSHDVGRVHRDV
jgi:hypothetical protein